jgi:hypothetical protein
MEITRYVAAAFSQILVAHFYERFRCSRFHCRVIGTCSFSDLRK